MTINHERAILVKKINAGATSKTWRLAAKQSFCIMVEERGLRYSVQLAHDAQQRKAVALPKQVKSVVYTKRNAVKKLYNSAQLHMLPAPIRDALDRADEVIDFLVDNIDFSVMQTNKAIANLKRKIAKAVAQDPSLATGAVLDLLMSNGGDEDNYEILKLAKLTHLLEDHSNEEDDGTEDGDDE